MKSYTYYLIGYYARLPNSGFGFGRKYIAIAPDEVFDLDRFEKSIAREAKLPSNNICVLNRTEVSVEEYNYNVENFEKIEEARRNQLEMNLDKENSEPQGDQLPQEDVRPEVAGSVEDNTNGESAEEAAPEA